MANSIRFIAGAVCPSCHSMDKLSYIKEDVQETVLCVSCGYKLSQNTGLKTSEEIP